MKKGICMLLALFCLTGCGTTQELAISEASVTTESAPAVQENLMEVTHTATMVVEGLGEIELELYGNNAPLSVENFVSLAQDGFYDGLTFHRVISGFMIQGGDPLGTGTGGSEETIKGEFSANGVENPLSHTRGILSMARSMSMDSASSQFFIMHADYPSLDGQYAAFGKVTSGLDVVDAIAAMDTDSNDKPTTDVVIQSITIHT